MLLELALPPLPMGLLSSEPSGAFSADTHAGPETAAWVISFSLAMLALPASGAFAFLGLHRPFFISSFSRVIGFLAEVGRGYPSYLLVLGDDSSILFV